MRHENAFRSFKEEHTPRRPSGGLGRCQRHQWVPSIVFETLSAHPVPSPLWRLLWDLRRLRPHRSSRSPRRFRNAWPRRFGWCLTPPVPKSERDPLLPLHRGWRRPWRSMSHPPRVAWKLPPLCLHARRQAMFPLHPKKNQRRHPRCLPARQAEAGHSPLA